MNPIGRLEIRCVVERRAMTMMKNHAQRVWTILRGYVRQYKFGEENKLGEKENELYAHAGDEELCD